jgi:ASC-1-like (ASCH) protein
MQNTLPWWAIALIVVVVLVVLVAMVWGWGRSKSYYGGEFDELDSPGEYDYDGDYIEGDGILGGGPFRISVRDPWYTEMLQGKKLVEARLDKKPFSTRLKAGSPVTVVRSRPHGSTEEYPGGRYKYNTKVKRIDKYKDIEALLKAEGVGKVYPGKKTAAEGVEIFREFAPDVTLPVLAIELAAPEK